MSACKLPEPWLSLAYLLGGVEQLAEQLGTSPRTVNRWAKGERKPSGPSKKLIDCVFSDFGMEPPR